MWRAASGLMDQLGLSVFKHDTFLEFGGGFQVCTTERLGTQQTNNSSMGRIWASMGGDVGTLEALQASGNWNNANESWASAPWNN
ncbi:hypothetical protein QQS21_010033 [Conoideocrella luteorostrata]|uniref:Uncharacterized protein n=1 Tax=Conoideocrella luteorostrata TaxID=1105319 RepID=A0AAJ0CFU4_9HYPO|nr:hypothetical protein QQS21_010033 [Conoideocrella luteorostrata]